MQESLALAIRVVYLDHPPSNSSFDTDVLAAVVAHYGPPVNSIVRCVFRRTALTR
jgi:hypothetical protein